MSSILSRFLTMLILVSGLVGFQNLPLQPAVPASPAATTAAAALVMGGGHTCYLSNGSLKCWGYNRLGAVGDATYWDRPTPVQVSGLTSGVTAASAGVGFTCAIVSGAVRCWGDNQAGQLGNDLAPYQDSPTVVAGLGGSASLIAAGFDHACSLAGGSVKCWGLNANGQLGAGSTINHSHDPLTVTGLPSGIQALTAGGAHTCALTAAGGVKCWGYNYFGELGNGSNADSGTPVDVTGLASGVTALAAGYEHTCALVNGGVQCWGLNYTNKPAPVAGLTSGVTALVSGSSHLCAIHNGVMVCWGDNSAGQLGNGSLTDSAAPVAVSGLNGSVTAIGAGGSSSCALADGQLYCWGADLYGELGRGAMTQTTVPWVLNDLAGQTVTSIKSGSLHTCALTSAGSVLCWGNNMHGELGDGKGEIAPYYSALPVQVSGITSGATAIGGGETYSCAVVNGGAWCWGSNYYGELGDGTRDRRLVPVAVSGLSHGVSVLSSAPHVDDTFHTCAVVNGGAMCWGSNYNGELGNASNTDSNIPVPVSGLTSGVTDITVGSYHSCAVVSGGAKCWGFGWYGELGNNQNGINAKTNTPVAVTSLGSGVTALAGGDFSTCAIVNGGVKCWGRNNHGQLGNSGASDSAVPVQVSGLTSGVTAISVGGDQACAVKNGVVWCWGQNTVSALNNGQFQDSFVPVQISGLSGVTGISTAAAHSCALIGGQVRCWGQDYFGQLGVGRSFQSSIPVKVLGLGATPDIALYTRAGASGSVLSGAAAGFLPNQAVTLSANGHVLGSFTTNFRGFGAFVLTTGSASSGIYTLTASNASQQASASFTIWSGAIQRQQGGGYTFAVPAGIANPPLRVYLPGVRK